MESIIYYSWIEKMGYTEGNITKLENALKAAKLRRVICEISGTKGIDNFNNYKLLVYVCCFLF